MSIFQRLRARFTPNPLPIWCPFCKTYVPYEDSEDHDCPGILEIDGMKVAFATGEPVHDWRYSQSEDERNPAKIGLERSN